PLHLERHRPTVAKFARRPRRRFAARDRSRAHRSAAPLYRRARGGRGGGMERLNLIVSDLDGTLLGDDGALRCFAAWYDERRADFRLVYSSGRFLDSVRQSIAETYLPEPDAVICGVGTEIYAGAADEPLP